LLAFTVLASDAFKTEDYDAGLIELEPGDEMFYWLVRSRKDPENDPLVLWLNGGPGCASELGLFYENGPWTINDDLSLETNEHSWNEIANMIYVDQPLGTGFSKTNKPDHIARNEKMVADTFFVFLEKFVEKFPEFQGRPFYITGESYAGHYIPAITAKIVEMDNPKINLISSAIGNGWVDPVLQYPQYTTFAVENELIGSFHAKVLDAGYWLCAKTIGIHLGAFAYIPCELLTNTILGNPINPRFNVYDIRKKCIGDGCYPMENLDILLNKPEIQQILGVGKRFYSQCSKLPQLFMMGDHNRNLRPKVEYALDNGVGILVYSGDKDFICNWRGGEAWTHAIGFEGGNYLEGEEYQQWTVDGEGAGEYKRSGSFTFLRIYDAGHMVPMDQPKRALDMLQKFINQEF